MKSFSEKEAQIHKENGHSIDVDKQLIGKYFAFPPYHKPGRKRIFY